MKRIGTTLSSAQQASCRSISRIVTSPGRACRLLSPALMAAALMAGAALPAQADDAMQWKVLGQPLATGLIQSEKEQPFFEQFAKETGLPISADYKPVDTTGIKDTEQLRVLKAGLFDMASLRMSPNSRDAPVLSGIDLIGLNSDYATARKVVDAYTPVLDRQLQQRFNTKLLGVWPFGPQILFCNAPVSSVSDIAGLKVRVNDQNLAKFIESLGATPVPMSFPEVHQALSLGVVDCGVTGPSSANSAGWPEVTTHQLTLGMGMSMSGYAVSLRAWKQLDEAQQNQLQTAIDRLSDEIWEYSESLYNDALNCNSGQQPCTTGKSYDLTSVDPSEADLEKVHDALVNISLPTWAEICDQSTSNCSADWKDSVGPIVGLD